MLIQNNNVFTNPLLLPVMAIIWLVDLWLWVSAIRWILEKGLVRPNRDPWQTLQKYSDFLPKGLCRFWQKAFNKSLSLWLAWLICLMGVLFIRNWLWSVILSLQTNL